MVFTRGRNEITGSLIFGLAGRRTRDKASGGGGGPGLVFCKVEGSSIVRLLFCCARGRELMVYRRGGSIARDPAS